MEGLAPGRLRAPLSLYPVFGVHGVRAGGASDADSFVITIHNPPLADQVVVRRIPPGQDTIQISIAVDLTADKDTVDIAFEGYSSASGVHLYSGSVTAVLSAGRPTTVPVAATYVGPGQGIDSLLVSPTAVTLAPAATQDLTVTGYDNNAPMLASDVPVFFTTENAAVATVSAAGVITAVAVGSTRVFTTSVALSSIEDTTDVSVSTIPSPAIGLSSTAVTFNAQVGGADPAAQAVQVTNSGGGTLSGLAVGTITYGAGATGWLTTASLGGATAPTSLTLQPTTGSLAAGSYTATVPITSGVATNSPRTITVTFTVAANPPVIALSPTSVSITATAAGGNPAPATVNITNTGGGTLSGLAVGTITYGAGASGWLAASLGTTTAPTTLSLQATVGSIAAGSYTATVPVTSGVASNSPQNVSVTFTVNAAAPASITLAPGYAEMLTTSTMQLTLTAKDGLGNPTTPPAVTYTSRSPSVATVDATGLVTTASAGGTAVIVASGGGLSDSVMVAVMPGGTAAVSAISFNPTVGRAFDVHLVGDSVRVLVRVNLTAMGGEKLGSYADSIQWNPAVLRYVRDTVIATIASDFVAPTVNRTNASSGILQFGAADAVGNAGLAVTLIRIVFVAQAPGTTTFIQTLSDLTAAGTFLYMLPAALIVNGTVHVQ